MVLERKYVVTKATRVGILPNITIEIIMKQEKQVLQDKFQEVRSAFQTVLKTAPSISSPCLCPPSLFLWFPPE